MLNKDYRTRVLLINVDRLEKFLLWNLLVNNFEVVGIVSDLDVKKIVYFLEYDSFHGKFIGNQIKKISSQTIKDNQKLIIEFENKKKISLEILSSKKANLNTLKELKIDFIVGCSDQNITPGQLKMYMKTSKKVFLSANKSLLSKSEFLKVIAFPFNHNKINEKNKIFLIPSIETVICSILIKALQEKLKIESCNFETLQGANNKMNFLDSVSKEGDLISGRSIFSNIIPINSSFETQILKSFLKSNDINVSVLGSAYVLPINSGSLLRLNLQIKKIHKESEVNDILNQGADAQIGFSLKPLSAKDIESTNYYGVIDKNLTSILSTKNNQILNLGIWFDQETSKSICFFKTIQFVAGELLQKKTKI